MDGFYDDLQRQTINRHEMSFHKFIERIVILPSLYCASRKRSCITMYGERESERESVCVRSVIYYPATYRAKRSWQRLHLGGLFTFPNPIPDRHSSAKPKPKGASIILRGRFPSPGVIARLARRPLSLGIRIAGLGRVGEVASFAVEANFVFSIESSPGSDVGISRFPPSCL